jgi:FkbH-like protein
MGSEISTKRFVFSDRTSVSERRLWPEPIAKGRPRNGYALKWKSEQRFTCSAACIREMSTTTAESQASAPQILIGATFTATPLEETLQFWVTELALPHQIGFAPYQQLFQTLISPASAFASNARGVNVALFRLEDLGDGLPEIEEHADELADALITSSKDSRVPLIASLCPPSSRFLETDEHQRFAERVEARLLAKLANQPHLHIVSANRTIARYQVTEIEDPTAERTGHVPYHPSFFTALGTEISRIAAASERKPLKVIAFDCDNTLWSGVCGEDGPQGVEIDAGRRALQKSLLEQKQAGVLLAIASKNNEADVRETFAIHPEMILRWGDIVAHRINWDSKSQNLLELAVELNLGLDSFVFLDDDSKECAEVRSELPEVATLQIPHRTQGLARFLDHAWIFDRLDATTAEDRQRSKLYAEQVQRTRFERQANDLREFLAGLRLEILFAPVTAETLPRAAQLTQRTNQMNFTLHRFSEAELKSALDSGSLEAFTVSVSDRFGSYGLVGIALFRDHGDAFTLEDFLLSCRALGRGVEHKMLAHVAGVAANRGHDTLKVNVRRGPRNQPAFHFLESVGVSVPSSDQPTELELRIADLQTLEFPGNIAVPLAGATTSAPQVRQQKDARTVDWERIAGSLQTAAQIGEAIRQRRRQSGISHREIGTPPRTELQSRLAGIWCDLLGLDAVGIEEDFFDLGGHSLLAVQLLSRIRQEIGIDLPDSVIYSEKLRIDNLARTIELQRLGVGDQEAYETMLAEIESLSDDEVAALLAEEEGRA